MSVSKAFDAVMELLCRELDAIALNSLETERMCLEWRETRQNRP